MEPHLILAAEPASGSGLDALGINGWAFFSQLVTFLIVLFILWRFVLPVFQRTLEKRQATIREGLENAEKARRDLTEANQRAEQILVDARRQGQESIERASKNAEQVARQIEEEARARAEQTSQREIARVQQEIARARMDLSREVVNLSIAAAGRVIERSVDSNDNRRLVEEFVTTSDHARNN